MASKNKKKTWYEQRQSNGKMMAVDTPKTPRDARRSQISTKNDNKK